MSRLVDARWIHFGPDLIWIGDRYETTLMVGYTLGFGLCPPRACAGCSNRRGKVGLLEAVQLKKQLDHKDFVLINTHVPYEGEITGTDLFIPYD